MDILTIKRICDKFKYLIIVLYVLQSCNTNTKSKIDADPYGSNQMDSICIATTSGILDTVRVKNVVLLRQPLSVFTFSNGDSITQCTTASEWVMANQNRQPAMFILRLDKSDYEQKIKNVAPSIFEKMEISNNWSIEDENTIILYNWYAVNDQRSLAPTGWHIPNKDEWVDLSGMMSVTTTTLTDYDNLSEFSTCQFPFNPVVIVYGTGKIRYRWIWSYYWTSSPSNEKDKALAMYYVSFPTNNCELTLSEDGPFKDVDLSWGLPVLCIKDYTDSY